MENQMKTVRTHRVGTVTAGLSMVVFGIMLLLYSLFEMIDFSLVLSLWPLILVGLGIELLASNIGSKKIVYDKGAVFLMIMMFFFVMGMAVVEICLEAAKNYIYC